MIAKKLLSVRTGTIRQKTGPKLTAEAGSVAARYR
jgi:hypothetical protein